MLELENKKIKSYYNCITYVLNEVEIWSLGVNQNQTHRYENYNVRNENKLDRANGSFHIAEEKIDEYEDKARRQEENMKKVENQSKNIIKCN